MCVRALAVASERSIARALYALTRAWTTATRTQGDVLIAATDGVLDNLFDMELQAVVSEHLRVFMGDDPLAAQESVNVLATTIAERANAVGMVRDDPSLKTPIKIAAAEEGYTMTGGKVDDIAVVCGVVRRGDRPGQRVVHNFNGAAEGVMVAARECGVVVPSGSMEPRPAQAVAY